MKWLKKYWLRIMTLIIIFVPLVSYDAPRWLWLLVGITFGTGLMSLFMDNIYDS